MYTAEISCCCSLQTTIAYYCEGTKLETLKGMKLVNYRLENVIKVQVLTDAQNGNLSFHG